MKIVILEGYTLNPGDLSWKELEKYGELTIYDRTKEEEVLERIRDAEIVFVNKTPLSDKIFKELSNLKYVGVLATGYDKIDIEAAREEGVVVTNIPNYGTASVAQFVFALLLEITHHVWEHSRAVKKGEWSKRKDFTFWNYPLIELKDKVMGIIGYGRIGKNTAEIAKAFGMKVITNNRNNTDKDNEGDVEFVSIEELFKNSDVISLHCPLNDESEGIINKESISKMKDGAILINTSRGGLVIEEDLADALNKGKLFGAASDVLSKEPPTEKNPLLGAKNMIITPHIAWAPKESRERLLDIAVKNLESFLEDKPINILT